MASRMWLLSLGCLFFSCVFAFECPPEHLIRPCSCDLDNHSIECKGIKGQDILEGVFRRLGNSKVENFVLRNSEVEYIPASSIERNAFQRIAVLNSVMSKVFETVPSISNHLDTLSFHNVTVHGGLKFGYLKHLQKLETLYIEDTVVPELGKEFSESLSHVIRDVSLFNTKTRSIDFAFTGKPKLEEVSVDIASLTHLLRASFPYPVNNLKSLSFSDNQIETLPADLFVFMNKLYKVSLTSNKISEISESVFGTVYDQLKFLALADNPIKCDCSIKWLTLRNSEGKMVTGTCVEPGHLEGKNIIDLKQSDFPDCS